jgi:hypothetical protein
MRKLNHCVQTYLLLASPLVIAMMIWGTIQPESEISKLASPLVKMLWSVLAWNLMAWFAVLILFLVSLVLIPNCRNTTLQRLANMKERDEREEIITAKAAKFSFVAVLSLIILLLFFSMFSIQISRLPADQAINGKTGTLSVGMNFNLLENQVKSEKISSDRIIFETKDIPLSKSGILLVILVWQMMTFHLRARKQLA